jgi:N-acetylated-alpha-linked acidic dipeptidase
MLLQTTRSLEDPSGKSLYDAWKATAAREKEEGKQSGQMNDSGTVDENLADTRIGSGSDHTVFLNFVGMPVIGLQFDGPYGVYHSAYDDFFWMNQFGDPGYRYQRAATGECRFASVRFCDLRQQYPPVRA